MYSLFEMIPVSKLLCSKSIYVCVLFQACLKNATGII